MRLLLDQDIYKTTTDQLRLWGHDVVTAREIGMHRAGDEDLLKKARESSRIFVTRDKDFGRLVFLKDELWYCQLFCVNFLTSNSLRKGRFLRTFPIGVDLQCNSIFRQIKARRV